jgi:hypothetical protein
MTTQLLLAPYHHVAALKSKNLRDAFIDAIDCMVGKIHNASLLLYDI